MATSRKLAVPRSGVGRLTRVDDLPVDKELGQIIAAWQTEERSSDQPGQGYNVPKRVVIRCDGVLVDQASARDAQHQQTSPGFPCAVLEIRYTIGGLTKKVLVDALSQSALTVWAESVDVVPVWDERRLARLEDSIAPCLEQLLAAAINSDEIHGDSGPADARWLDVIHQDFDEGEGDPEWSIHPIPEGARGMRFLNALISGDNTSVADTTLFVAWSADTFDNYPNGLVQLNINGATTTSIVIVPTVARYLFLAFPSGTIASFDVPAWIEWIMAPATLPGF